MASTEIYILCDMEGITGAATYEADVFPDAPNYPSARQWLTDDLKAAMAGAQQAGADAFTVYDMRVLCKTSAFRDRLHRVCGGEIVGGDALLLRGPDARAVYSLFRKSQVRQ